jgi:hypothetical protein
MLLQVGCGPTATYFLCFAKESKQRKAMQVLLPFGFPFRCEKKWENVETRFAQTTTFSFPFFITPKWQYHMQKIGSLNDLSKFRCFCFNSPNNYFVSANNSRPINIRRISLVPAPISYNFASRHKRPTEYSLM